MGSVIQLPLDDSTTLRAPAYSTTRLAGAVVAVDPSAPHWIATDERGVRLLALFDGQRPLRDVVSTYASLAGLDVTRAWLHVETFARDLLRQGFVTVDGASSRDGADVTNA